MTKTGVARLQALFSVSVVVEEVLQLHLEEGPRNFKDYQVDVLGVSAKRLKQFTEAPPFDQDFGLSWFDMWIRNEAYVFSIIRSRRLRRQLRRRSRSITKKEDTRSKLNNNTKKTRNR